MTVVTEKNTSCVVNVFFFKFSNFCAKIALNLYPALYIGLLPLYICKLIV